MQQYKDLLNKILESGTDKPAARAGMPGSKSLFGYQFRHNLQNGFPILTTKKVNFKNIAVELIWFLQGGTNIKYLVDRGVNIWNEDAYNYYVKVASSNNSNWNSVTRDNRDGTLSLYTFNEFIDIIRLCIDTVRLQSKDGTYTLGDCGYQYGKVWRNWPIYFKTSGTGMLCQDDEHFYTDENVDQISNLIKGLRENPEGRRHIVTAVDPAHDTDLALYWCHSMFQFNCRPLTLNERLDWVRQNMSKNGTVDYDNRNENFCDQLMVPKYYLDCQMYQRSADVFLGVPYNITSYALLIHIVAKICNMIPGEFIHTFGDVHIYDNHIDQVREQLSREERTLPTLEITDEGNDWAYLRETLDFSILDSIIGGEQTDFTLKNYAPHPAIKGKLSTGLQ